RNGQPGLCLCGEQMNWKRMATVWIALVILGASGLAHGVWGERWASSTLLQDAADRVDRVPLAIGEWKAQSLDGDASAFAQAGAQKFWTRAYVHSRKKATVLVILMCGRAGRIAGA